MTLIPGPVQAVLDTFKAGPGISPQTCWRRNQQDWSKDQCREASEVLPPLS
jgi:hypothetical protein